MNKTIDLPANISPLVLIGDVTKKLRQLPDKCIDVIITSPPYYKQREYGVKGEIGQEETPEKYVKKIIEVGIELRRVLKDTGSYWLNIGDKYISKKLQLIPYKVAIGMQETGWIVRDIVIWHKHPNPMPTSIKNRFNTIYEPIIFFIKDSGRYFVYDYYFDLDPLRVPQLSNFDTDLPLTLSDEEYKKIKSKLEKRINNNSNSKFIGHENNRGASPGARSILYGEYYTKQRKHKITKPLKREIILYLKEWRKKKDIPSKEIDIILGKKDTAGHWFRLDPGGSIPRPEDWWRLKEILGFNNKYDKIITETHWVLQTVKPHPKGKNPGNIWQMAPGKLKDTHFSIFPEELPRRVIQICCPKNGIVLDPFAGSGTTGQVAKELKRRSILIDLKKEYVDIIQKRCGEIKIPQ